MTITSEHLFTLEVDVSPPVEVGNVPTGFRRVVPITGGKVHGPALRGEVLAGGADWNLLRVDGVVHVWAKYEIRTNDGHVVSITNEGFLKLPEGVQPTGDPARPTIVTRPTFEVAEGGPTWLNSGAYAGELKSDLAKPGSVQIAICKLVSA